MQCNAMQHNTICCCFFLLHLSSRFISYLAPRTCHIRTLNKQTNNNNHWAEQIYDNFFQFCRFMVRFFFLLLFIFWLHRPVQMSHTTWCNMVHEIFDHRNWTMTNWTIVNLILWWMKIKSHNLFWLRWFVVFNWKIIAETGICSLWLDWLGDWETYARMRNILSAEFYAKK